ncbi:MAG TPA: histidinol-phosphate transaminase [bacterium]
MRIEPNPHLQRIQTYKPGRPIEEVIRELNLKGEVIKLASNENPLGTSPLALEAMKRTMEESALYPDDNCFYVKEIIAKKFNVDISQLFIGNGSVEIMPYLTLTYLSAKDSAVVSQSAFIWYKIAVNIAGGELIEAPMKDHTHDLKAMLKAIKSNTKLLFIANPNNPTGTIVTKEEFDVFLEEVPDHVIVVLDEAYKEYISDPVYPNSAKYFGKKKNLVILRTMSKMYGLAGMRLGFMLADQDIVSNVMKLRISFNVNRIVQSAAIAAFDDVEHISKSRTANDAGKQYLYDEYKKLGVFFVPTYGNFIFVDFARDSKIVFEELQKQGVITRTIKEYGFPNALRITIGTEKQNRRLISTLKKIL